MRALINIMPVVMPRAQVSIQLSACWKTNQETIHTSALLAFHRGVGTIPVSGYWLIIAETMPIAVQPLRKASGWKRAWEFWQIFAGMMAIMQMTIARVFRHKKTEDIIGIGMLID